MRRGIATALTALLGLSLLAAPQYKVTDVYDLKMSVRVPRIYDNSTSEGYRKYQTQIVRGYMSITYQNDERPIVEVYGLTNQTHKISGKKIGYMCSVDNEGIMGPITRINLIGSNAKDEFKTASVVFYLDAEPNYNRGEDDEDNSLLVTMSGYGTTTTRKFKGVQVISSLRGSIAGTLGCGCTAYGHISPTRVAGPVGPTDRVDDVASVFGTWTAKLLPSKSRVVVCNP